ncbi:hypothetical protein ACFE04_019167 [Oxalis oulophora]
MAKRKKIDDSYEYIDLTTELEDAIYVDDDDDDDDDDDVPQKTAANLDKHRTCWKHTIANLKALSLKRKEADIERYKLSSPCILGSFPQRKRSPRGGGRSKRISKRDSSAGPKVTKSCATKRATNCTLRMRGVSRRDLMSMKMTSNDFEIYMENVWNSLSEDKRSSFTYIDSVWFDVHMKGKFDVMPWIKKRDIFSKKYVFVPIVCWSHWCLLIFCNFGESLQSKSKVPCMLLLDSLELAEPRRYEPNIRKFVLDIYREEGRPETKREIYNIPLLVPQVPQQRDGEECGKYVLYYINRFAEAAPENFTIDSYPYFMKRDWFTVEDVEHFSKRLDTKPLKRDK